MAIGRRGECVRRRSHQRHAAVDQQHRLAARLGRGGRRCGGWAGQCTRLRRHTGLPADVHDGECQPNGGDAHSRSIGPVDVWRPGRPVVPGLGSALATRWHRGTLHRRHVDRYSRTQGQPLPTVEVGGTQRLGSAFVQDTWRPRRLTIALGAHGDVWHSNPGRRVFEIFRIVQSACVGVVSHRREWRHRSRRRVSRIPCADAERALSQHQRRQYADTADEALEPERLTGGDVGVMVTHGRASARVTGF